MKQVTAVEVIVTYISIGWALVMFTNPIVFNASANFNMVHNLFQHQWIIGLIAILCALVKIFGLVLHNNRVRWLGLVMSAIFWIVMACCFLVANGSIQLTTGFVVYSGIATMCLWVSKEVMISGRADKRSAR